MVSEVSDKRLKHKNTQGYIITYSERQKAETQKQVVNLIEQNHTFLINFNWILFQPFVAHYILRVSLFMTRKRTPPNPYLLQGCYAHLAATCHYCKITSIIFSIIYWVPKLSSPLHFWHFWMAVSDAVLHGCRSCWRVMRPCLIWETAFFLPLCLLCTNPCLRQWPIVNV